MPNDIQITPDGTRDIFSCRFLMQFPDIRPPTRRQGDRYQSRRLRKCTKTSRTRLTAASMTKDTPVMQAPPI